MSKYIINPCDKCTIKERYGGDYRCSCCDYTRLQGKIVAQDNKIKKLERENIRLKERNSQLKEEITFMKKGLEW